MASAKNTFESRHSELTSAIIGAFFQVHNELGYGISEKVYENALAFVLREQSMDTKSGTSRNIRKLSFIRVQ